MAHGKNEAQKSKDWDRWLVRNNFHIRSQNVAARMSYDPSKVTRTLRRLPIKLERVPEPALFVVAPRPLNSAHCTEFGVWSYNEKIA